MYRVADQIVEILERAGVKRIYGIVGDSLNPITDALRKKKTIEWIHVRHEEAAAFAAERGSQLSGNWPSAAAAAVRQPPFDQRPV